jgi:DNA-binding CsgD family transcriptional regulator
VQVRDPQFTAWAHLGRTEFSAYTGEPWPRADLEAQLGHALARGNTMAAGIVEEGLALGYLVDREFEAADRHFVGPTVGAESIAFHRLDAMVRRAGARHALGDLRGAREILDDAEEHADRWGAGPVLRTRIGRRAAALSLDGDAVGEAEERAHAALAHAAAGPFPSEVISALELLSSIAVARESWTEGARLHGAAERLRDSYGYRMRLEPERERLDRDLSTARQALGDEAFEAARREGSTLSLDDAVAYARRARGERKRPSHGWDGLTPTERQVADLALQGLSNADIAQQLIVGRETVKTHLSNVYAKVGVANRAQLAADAAKRGITPAEGNPT